MGRARRLGGRRRGDREAILLLALIPVVLSAVVAVVALVRTRRLAIVTRT